MEMIKGVTSTGFSFEVDKDVLEDAEFLELFIAVQNGDGGSKVFELIRNVLGEEQKKKLFDHCRNDAGRVPLPALTDEVTDIFTELGKHEKTKN